MAHVKSKNAGAKEGFETADRLHSAAIHLLRRLRVHDRESGAGPAQLSALSSWCLAARDLWASLRMPSKSVPRR